MEKNGNTVVPGDKVTLGTSTFGYGGKVAALRGTGVVRSDISEGRVKVAWEDGTETWESPDTLVTQ